MPFRSPRACARRRPARAALAVGGFALALGACAAITPARTPLAGEPVTNAYKAGGYRLHDERGAESILFLVARVKPVDGQTALCAAVGFVGEDGYNIFGHDGLPAITNRIKIRLDGRMLIEDSERFPGPYVLKKVEDIGGRQAGCYRLDLAWQAGFDDRSRLEIDMPDRVRYTD